MQRLSIRVRLTLWYGGVLAATLVGFGLAVYWMLGAALMERIEDGLEGEFDEIEDRLKAGVTSGRVLGEQQGHHDHHESYLVRVIDPAWRVVLDGGALAGMKLTRADLTGGTSASYQTVSLGGSGPQRVLFGTVRTNEGEWLLHVATPLGGYYHELDELRVVLLTIVPVGLIAAVAGGYWLAGRVLTPVDEITKTARRMSVHTLGDRIVVTNPHDEIGRLGGTLNEMIGRLEQSVAAIRQFTTDASHELLTPLTAMRTEAEVALRTGRSPEQYERVLASMVEEIERMTKLADSLLMLSREDAGVAGSRREAVRLDELVRDVAEHMRVLAEGRGVTLTTDSLTVVTVAGDAERLRQVFFNLLDNAIHHTPERGSITVRGRVQDREAVVEVVDTGVGIPAEDLPRIFDRFYRVDKSRSRERGGVGLGLSISKALVESHQGRIEVESTLGKGSTFRVVLPLASGGFS